jgi:hypothetical protein
MVFLAEFLDPNYLKTKLDYMDLSISGLRDALRGAANKTLSDLDTDLTNIYSKLDANLSTRASETTLSGLSGKFPSAAALSDTLSNPTTTLIGSALLGFDGTNWRRVMTDTSSRLKVQLDSIPNPSNLDITLSGLRDALRGAANKTLSDLDTDLTNIYSRLDVSLSTRASETTLSGLSGKFPSAAALGDAMSNPTTTLLGSALLGFDGTNWERVMTDGSNRLKTQLDSIPNPPNLDTTLSSRLSESTFTGRFPSGAALSDTLSNPTTTLIGSALLGFDGTNWARVTAKSIDITGATGRAIAMLNALTPSRMPYMVDGINVTTTESSTTISAPGAKILKITNGGDVDCLIGINASVPGTNPLKVKARTTKVFAFAGATSVYYKTASGSTTISIEYFN